MNNPQKQAAKKYENPTISGKDNRTQAEKDKQKNDPKHADKKDASGKSSSKDGGCC